MTQSSTKKKNKKRPDLYLIVELLDNVGYTIKELEKKTGTDRHDLSPVVNDFENDGTVYRKYGRKKQDDNTRSGVFLYIGPEDNQPKEKLRVFWSILESFLEFKPFKSYPTQKRDFIKKLLTSEYFDSVIRTCGLDGLKAIYESFEEYMDHYYGFRSILSQTLWNQPALIEEYTINLPDSMKEYMESYRYSAEMLEYLDATRYLLKFLSRLDEIKAIKFHRQYLVKPLGELYRKLTQREVPITLDAFVTEGIRKFLELDLYLSPLTSFPMNFPVELLFERPFERVYTDFYIWDDEDIRMLVLRAYIVYSNFINVLSAGVVNSKIYVNDLEPALKQYIFYWNVASRNVDWLYYNVPYVLQADQEAFSGSTIYHIYSDTTGIQMKDLANGKLLLSRGFRYEMNHNSLTIDVDDPTKEIRICDCFKDEGLETEKISYEDVLAGIREKLKNATVVEDDGRLAYGTGFMSNDSYKEVRSYFNEEERQKYEKMMQFLDDQKRQDGHD